MKIQLASGSMYVERRGSGLPLLLTHGFPLSHEMWRPQIDQLAAHFDVIAPDLFGFGRSDTLPGTRSMAQMADDLAELLDALEVTQKVVYCGLSMGGYIGYPFVARHGQRLRGLVLADTKTTADTAEQATKRRQLAERARSEGMQVFVDAMIGMLVGKTTQSQRPGLVQHVRDLMLGAPVEGATAATLGMADRPDSTEFLSQIDVPTLVIVGEEDELSTPATMKSVADAIPTSAWFEVPAAGHLSNLENAHVFNAALLEFLEQLPA